jgi:DNA-directed RNA polymerase specialized sigma24 family protein
MGNEGRTESDEGKAVPSDAALIAEIVAGNLDGFHLLVERYEKKVTLYLSRYFKLTDSVEDVTQETFLRLFLRITKRPRVWPEGESILPLLMFIAARAAAEDFRKLYRLRRMDREALAIFSRDELFWAEAAASLSLLGIDVQRALDALPPDLHETAVLYILEGHSGADVAKMTHSSLDATWIRVHRARRLMMNFLERHTKGASHDIRVSPGTGTRPASSDAAPGLRRQNDETGGEAPAAAEAP